MDYLMQKTRRRQRAAKARERRGAFKPKRERTRGDWQQPIEAQADPDRGETPSNPHERPQLPENPATMSEAPAPTLTAFNPMRPMKPKTIEQALQLQEGAAVKRAIGKSMLEDSPRDYIGGRFELAEAEDMEAAAEAFLDVTSHVTGPVQVGNGGEVIVATHEVMGSIPGVVDTVRERQDMLTATASRERLELTGNALTLAADAAESIKPKNSLEKMLAHELAAAHRLAMLFANQSAALVEHCNVFGNINQTKSVEAARLANASARMMTSFQDGLLALERIRRGGRQTVKVVHQHVAVGPGGQAVVAGNLKSGGRKAAGGRSRNGR